MRCTPPVALLAATLVVAGCATSNHMSRDVAGPEPSAAGNGAHEHDHAATVWTIPALSKNAKLLGNLGSVHRNVTHTSGEAQTYFDQGLALTYGFNHDEAARSYAHAADIDSSCAMCFWGVAYTLGPNYNMPMLPERAQLAWDALGRAKKASKHATPVEQALIAALAKRYKGPAYVDPTAMHAYSQAYADAMREVAQRFPDDLDVQVLYAESLMNLNPWKLWTPDGQPAPGTDEIVSTLESVLARNPNHAGANHYYIHAVEASKTPQRAVASADRLPSLVPGAGHLVHMPAHIYQRVGRYADASSANLNATQVDQHYLDTMTPPGYYPFYVGHNYGFLAYSASMEGRSAVSLNAAQEAAKSLPKDIVCGMPGMDFFQSEPLLVMVRFGKWDEILATPIPDQKYQTLVALWHHAQGMALAAKARTGEAATHAQAIRDIGAKLPEGQLAGLNNGRKVLELSAMVVDARIADAKHQKNSVELWEQAVSLEDALAYNEPADWFYPVRHYLGAALLDQHRAREAEAVYRADLQRHPDNGWSLYGLSRALKAQKKTREAAEVDRQLASAWVNADVELVRTAY